MAKSTIYGLNEKDREIIREVVRRVNKSPRQVIIPQRRNPAVRSGSMRMARTTSTGTYPTRADACNAWELEFVTVTYTDEPGPQSLTIESSDDELIVARNINNDPFVPDGTILNIWNHNSLWWFDYRDEVQRATLQGELVAGGSVSVKVQVAGADTPGGAITATDKLGVMSGTSGEKCYIQWQREHAEYWIIQKECDNSSSISTAFVTPAPSWIQPRREESRSRRAGVM